MLNPRTRDAVEILNGLIRINNERIKFYKHFLDFGNALNPEFREFFALISGESYQNNIWLSIEIQTIEGNIEAETPTNELPSTRASKEQIPEDSTILIQCDLQEEKIREAYSTAMDSVYIPQYMRDLLKKQVRRLEAAKRQLGRLMS
ncbi:MAG: hypothetical protein ABW174_05640 [Flavitalea sp.]